MSRCIVLQTRSTYIPSAHDDTLRALLNERPELIAVVGVDGTLWEDAIDWLFIDRVNGDPVGGWFCCTTLHDNETLEEVVSFAEDWCRLSENPIDVRIVQM